MLVGFARAVFNRGRGLVELYPDHVITLMTPGTWYEYTGAALSTLSPDPTISLDSPVTPGQWTTLSGSTGFAGLFAYSGGVVANNKLYINGGGHADYHGNEWHAFDIVNMVWVRISWPDISASYGGAADGYQDDTSRPSAAHTYNGLAYSTTSGVMFRGGGSSSGASTGIDAGKPWTYVPSTDTYTELTATNYVGYLDTNVNGGPVCVCYDVTNNRFWQMTQYGLWSRDAASPTTPTLRKNALSDLPGTARADLITLRHDIANNQIVGLGASISYKWDIATPNAPTVTHSHTWTGTGSVIVTTASLGLDYDVANNQLIGWSGGANIYTIDAVNNIATTVTPAGSNTVTPTAAHVNGTNGRFRYIGQWGGKSCFIAVNSVSGSVYIYKRA